MKFIKQLGFKHMQQISVNHEMKKRKGFEKYSTCPCRCIWFPVSICSDLSALFAMFVSLTSYVLVLILLITGYALKYTYNIPKNSSYLFNIGNLIF